MHHFDAISQKISASPGPPPAGGGDTLPLSALRASVKPSASLVTCAPPPPPAVELLDPPLTCIAHITTVYMLMTIVQKNPQVIKMSLFHLFIGPLTKSLKYTEQWWIQRGRRRRSPGLLKSATKREKCSNFAYFFIFSG